MFLVGIFDGPHGAGAPHFIKFECQLDLGLDANIFSSVLSRSLPSALITMELCYRCLANISFMRHYFILLHRLWFLDTPQKAASGEVQATP